MRDHLSEATKFNILSANDEYMRQLYFGMGVGYNETLSPSVHVYTLTLDADPVNDRFSLSYDRLLDHLAENFLNKSGEIGLAGYTKEQIKAELEKSLKNDGGRFKAAFGAMSEMTMPSWRKMFVLLKQYKIYMDMMLDGRRSVYVHDDENFPVMVDIVGNVYFYRGVAEGAAYSDLEIIMAHEMAHLVFSPIFTYKMALVFREFSSEMSRNGGKIVEAIGGSDDGSFKKNVLNLQFDKLVNVMLYDDMEVLCDYVTLVRLRNNPQKREKYLNILSKIDDNGSSRIEAANILNYIVNYYRSSPDSTFIVLSGMVSNSLSLLPPGELQQVALRQRINMPREMFQKIQDLTLAVDQHRRDNIVVLLQRIFAENEADARKIADRLAVRKGALIIGLLEYISERAKEVRPDKIISQP